MTKYIMQASVPFSSETEMCDDVNKMWHTYNNQTLCERNLFSAPYLITLQRGFILYAPRTLVSRR
jgi:hypothetical protein